MLHSIEHSAATEQHHEIDQHQQRNAELSSRLAQLQRNLSACTDAKRLRGVSRLIPNVQTTEVHQGSPDVQPSADAPLDLDSTRGDSHALKRSNAQRPWDYASIARELLTQQARSRSGEVNATDVLGTLEKERQEELWKTYRAERKLRSLRRCWRNTERLHARSIARLTVLEDQVVAKEATSADLEVALLRAQEADEADLAEEERLVVEAAAVRARLERSEADLETERRARLNDRRKTDAACASVEQELETLTHHIAALERQLS